MRVDPKFCEILRETFRRPMFVEEFEEIIKNCNHEEYLAIVCEEFRGSHNLTQDNPRLPAYAKRENCLIFDAWVDGHKIIS
jgi:hypothetical protein